MSAERLVRREPWDVRSERNDFEFPGEKEGLNTGQPQENPPLLHYKV